MLVFVEKDINRIILWTKHQPSPISLFLDGLDLHKIMRAPH